MAFDESKHISERDKVLMLREKTGLTQAEFARRLGVCSKTVYRWEAGYYNPKQIYRDKIKNLFEEYEAD